MLRRLLPLVLLFVLGGCGYFNSLYNANRRFADAERAQRRGDAGVANRGYNDAIEKAAVSYRRYPDSRWADDALLLIGRARFALRNDRAAIAAMRVVLEKSSDPEVRASAHAYLGAALLRSDSTGAHMYLDSAVARLPASTDVGALARVWRARALFDAGNSAGAFRDLEAAFGNRLYAFDAALEAASHAAALRDSVQFDHAIDRLAATRFDGGTAEPVTQLLQRAADRWSPAAVFVGSAVLEQAAWRADLTDAVGLKRAELALAAGDSAAALEVLTRIADQAASGTGDTPRLLATKLRLRAAVEAEELERIRQYLVPAYANAEALQLQRQIKAAQILILRGSTPAAALSLFAAAEMLRDDIGAALLARRLFLDFTELVPDAPWSGKALLAAHTIRPDAETEARLRAAASNPYVLAATEPGRATGVGAAEEQLARGLRGLRDEALAEAMLRDVIVGRAVAVLDSTRASARSDSVRIACGTLLDSLAIAGIRADSTRAACLRGDSVRIAIVLRADTMTLVDTARARARQQAGRSGQVPVDTIPLRP